LTWATLVAGLWLLVGRAEPRQAASL
jgi:hypothetical protein